MCARSKSASLAMSLPGYSTDHAIAAILNISPRQYNALLSQHDIPDTGHIMQTVLLIRQVRLSFISSVLGAWRCSNLVATCRGGPDIKT